MSLHNSFEKALNQQSESIDRDLIRELVSLRQLKDERQSLIATNNQLIAQLSELEVNSVDLKFQLEARDMEISKLRRRIRNFQAPQGDRQILNLTLSLNTSRNKSELTIDSISSQKLDASDDVTKEIFQEQNKSRTQIMVKQGSVQERGSSFIRVKELEHQLEEAKKDIQRLVVERDYYKGQLVPSLEKSLQEYQKRSEEAEQELVLFKKQVCCEQEGDKLIKKQKSEKGKVVNKPSSQNKLSSGKLRSKGKITNGKATNYKPSFLRQKKSSINETFADSFPEDNELE